MNAADAGSYEPTADGMVQWTGWPGPRSTIRRGVAPDAPIRSRVAYHLGQSTSMPGTYCEDGLRHRQEEGLRHRQEPAGAASGAPFSATARRGSTRTGGKQRPGGAMAGQHFAISPELMHETIEGETIMINGATGNYYSLDPIASEVWQGIELGASVADIVAFLVERYGVSRADVETEVLEFVRELEQEGLVVPRPASDGSVDLSAVAEAPSPAASFSAPRVDKHTDMQDLILLDPVHEVDPERGWPHVPKRSTG
jgi:Coenzyme PQQ synthesis protein D (PqqD)